MTGVAVTYCFQLKYVEEYKYDMANRMKNETVWNMSKNTN